MKKSKLQKTALKPFDDLLKAAKGIAKKWDLKSIPLLTLKTMIKIAVVKVDKMDLPPEAIAIKQAYLEVYDNLFSVCETRAKEMGTKNVSIEFLESCIKVIKIFWEKGYNNQKS